MAYSIDLRSKAIEAVEQGNSQKSVAKMLGIGLASLERWIKRKRETGSVEAISPPGAPRKIDKAGEVKLREYLKENPESKIRELCEYMASEGYEQVSNSTMTRLLKAMNISRKKNVSPSSKR